MGSDISQTVPSEAVTLAHEKLRWIFLQKMTEGKICLWICCNTLFENYMGV
jgi:hypothetical protein